MTFVMRQAGPRRLHLLDFITWILAPPQGLGCLLLSVRFDFTQNRHLSYGVVGIGFPLRLDAARVP